MERTRRREENQHVIDDDDDIPDGVLTEILYRLPMKTQFRFRIVSKRWRCILTEIVGERPSWSVLFHSFKYYNGLRILHSPDCKFKSPNFKLRFLPNAPLKVLAASNGLLLCCKVKYLQIDYYICNPLTAEWVCLPKPLHRDKRVDVGFHSERQGYKVVRIRNKNKNLFAPPLTPRKMYLEVFDSETAYWRDVEVWFSPSGCCSYSISCKFQQPVFYNGIMHWFTSHNRIEEYDPNSNSCVSKLFQSHNDRCHYEQQLLGVCNGWLRLLDVDGYCEDCLFVWTLTDYDSWSWSLDFKIQHSYITELVSNYSVLVYSPLAFHPFKKKLVYLQLPFKGKRGNILCNIVCYDCETREKTIVFMHLPRLLDPTLVFPLVLPTLPTPLPALPN